MIDDESLVNWFVCPWCRSDEPAEPDSTDPEDTDIVVHRVTDGGKDVGLSVRCHSCGTDVTWDLKVGEKPEVYAHD
jgi:hypothetical protein